MLLQLKYFGLSNVREIDGISLFQISGREVFQSRLQRGTNSLDLTALSTGVYLMSIRTVSGIVLNQKFVK